MFIKFRKNESGQSIVLVTLMLTVLLGFGALAVDVGYMTFQRSRLQNAADSAALAGAVLLPNKSNYNVNESAVKYSSANISKTPSAEVKIQQTVDALTVGLTDLDATVISEVDRSDGTVTVKIEQTIPRFLGGIISNEEKIMKVEAKAKSLGKWNGQALPFVNIDLYALGGNIDVWDKNGSGDKEVLKNTTSEETDETTFITIDYETGLPVDKGKVAAIKTEVENMINNSETLYVFSLSQEVIASGLCPVINKSGELVYRNFASKFMPGDVIPLSAIVLLRIKDLGYEDMIINGIVEEVYTYDESNKSFNLPDDYSGAGALEVTSNLIY
ncbi:MAG: pilus assembly protein TadG-related protein [Sedimentibacter saalensis]|uniref:pilus assembly protein TadG-related protein n=1 Tax=Sedimentibacter saalensis TaxID=130788 RepID=UPI0031581A1E